MAAAAFQAALAGHVGHHHVARGVRAGPLDLREFCEQLVGDHEESRRLQFQCEGKQFPVTADALRLRQALDNLLSNALKYSDGPVVVSLSAGSQTCQIEVRDRGIGIPAGEQEGIFEPFFRASNTSGRPGHGLGLSIVKSCIEQHGGSVRFVSGSNQGTTFLLELPKAPLPKAAAQPGVLDLEDRTGALASQSPGTLPATAAPGSRALSEKAGKLRGIIVDDDPLVRSVMRDLLEAAQDIVIVFAPCVARNPPCSLGCRLGRTRLLAVVIRQADQHRPRPRKWNRNP